MQERLVTSLGYSFCALAGTGTAAVLILFLLYPLQMTALSLATIGTRFFYCVHKLN